MTLMALAKKAAVVWTVGLLSILVAVGIGYAIEVLLMIFAGLLFSIVLCSVADFLSDWTGLGANASLALAVVLFLAVLGGGVMLLSPSIAEQIDELQHSLPRSVDRLEERVRRYAWGGWLLEKAPEPAELMPRRRDLFTRVTGIVSGTLGAVGAIAIIFFTGLYVAAQRSDYQRGLVKLVPPRNRKRAEEILREVDTALKWWLLGKVIAMVLVGVLTALGLWLLGVGMALTLGVLAAGLTFIPNFGPIIAVIPAVLIGLLDTPTTAVWVAVLYIAIQTVESYLVTPLIQQRTVSLPPALTITAQLLMAAFVGGIGLAFATPLTVIGLVLIRSIYLEDMLGDR